MQITPDDVIHAAWIGIAVSVATAVALTILAFLLHVLFVRRTGMRFVASTVSAVISVFILVVSVMVWITVMNELVNGPVAKDGTYFVTRVWIDPSPQLKLILGATIVVTWVIVFAVRRRLRKRQIAILLIAILFTACDGFVGDVSIKKSDRRSKGESPALSANELMPPNDAVQVAPDVFVKTIKAGERGTSILSLPEFGYAETVYFDGGTKWATELEVSKPADLPPSLAVTLKGGEIGEIRRVWTCLQRLHCSVVDYTLYRQPKGD